ncbi:MAG: histidine kinase dimerization/phospho-acceptor domain-containing protein, partial [Bryobacteraceae bacterium]
MTGSLFRRLILIAFAIVTITLLLLDTEVRQYVREREVAVVTQRLVRDAKWLSEDLAGIPDSDRQRWVAAAAARSQSRVNLIDTAGALLADSAHDDASTENQARRPEIVGALQKRTGIDVDYSAQPAALVHVAVPAQSHDGTVILKLTAPIEESHATALRQAVFAIALAAALLSLAIAFFISRSLSRRVSRLQQLAAGILGRSQTDRLPGNRGDDLASLERSLAGVAIELRRLLDRLSFESARREAILSGMAEGVLAVDPDLRVTFCNEAFLKAAGFRGNTFEGLALLELVRDPELRELLLSVLQTGAARKLRLKLSVETPRIFEVQSTPLATPAGRGAIAIFHDTTDLERLEQVRKDFVANVSHELRTPLAGIIGYAETLLDGGLDDNANKRRFVEIIRTNAIRLNSIAADLLVLSELEAGGDPPEPDIISIAAVLDSALIIVESEARLREVTLIREQIDVVYVAGSRL